MYHPPITNPFLPIGLLLPTCSLTALLPDGICKYKRGVTAYFPVSFKFISDLRRHLVPRTTQRTRKSTRKSTLATHSGTALTMESWVCPWCKTSPPQSEQADLRDLVSVNYVLRAAVFGRDEPRHIQNRANALGVRGWASQMMDGRIIGLLVGTREAVRQMKAVLEQHRQFTSAATGPQFTYVDEHSVSHRTFPPYYRVLPGFEIPI